VESARCADKLGKLGTQTIKLFALSLIAQMQCDFLATYAQPGSLRVGIHADQLR